MKKTIAILIAAIMILMTMTCVSVCFVAGALEATGECGENAKWEFDSSSGLLTISGTGSIDKASFFEQTAIKSLVINYGITGIDERAFAKCTSLRTIALPDSLETIGGAAFGGCNSLEEIVIPGSVKTIGSGAFSTCKMLQSAVIEEGVTRIETGAFTFTALKNVTIPSSVTVIGNGAFGFCDSLENVFIHEGVTSIDDTAFQYCVKLKSVVIPDSVTKMGESVFHNCKALKNVALSNNVTEIGEHSFSLCESLRSIVIPAGVMKIDANAFMDCSKLESVTLPVSVTDVYDGAFLGTELKTVNYEGDETQFSQINIEAGDTLLDTNRMLRNAKKNYNYNDCCVAVSASPAGKGTVTGWSVYTAGTDATVRATPNSEYSFIGWYEGNNLVSSDSIYQFNIVKNTKLWAKFAVHAHVPGEAVKENEVPATCKEAGSYDEVVYCTDCGVELSRVKKTIDKLDHTPGEVVKENEVNPTCTEAGGYDDVTYCTECGDEISRVKVTVDALGHIDEANDGLCDRCGEKMTGEGHCGYCGKIHAGFPDVLVGWGHTILNLFKTTKPEDAINTANEGAQDGAKLFQSIMNAGTDFADEFAKAVDGIQKTLIPLVQYFGKITETLQGLTLPTA
ncbi:MAG: leucine-rich repeat domain-containing protein [Clostridia bacterium]|nr:leucine-rich repeat domain-containing protein [Clostridia bacterium]